MVTMDECVGEFDFFASAIRKLMKRMKNNAIVGNTGRFGRDRHGRYRECCGVAWLQWIFLPLWGQALSALRTCRLLTIFAPLSWGRGGSW